MSEELNDLVANFDKLSNKAEADADEAVGQKIASVTRMNKREVQELFPDRGDQKKLAELIRIVKSADRHHRKVNEITRRAEEFAGIMVTLLTRFV